ncbi:helix-turn-helix transcriptional regulator [Roseomonas sp. SSH11]|uniref:Helix-turn-helix transcriptional regulator n=1 Tax=Pararoseomonas baculiformis TaxID=2820812 RepID=A0ABS4AKF3_9PROT|nr:helix-turn-helix transcriptional regulator [Pararoseomonas baculiformis]
MPYLRRSPRAVRIRELLLEYRLKAGLTQAEVASLIGRTQDFVSRLENGERRLTVEDFLDIASALNIDREHFLTDLQKIPAPPSDLNPPKR